MQYIERLFIEPDKSYFLFGPRGTGKSTYLRARQGMAISGVIVSEK